MNKTKILMIALQHSAKDDRIFYKESISLVKRGFDVTYLTLTNKDGDLKDMSGNILNKNNENEILVDGVKIVRLLPPTTRIDRFLKKIFLGDFQSYVINTIISFNADIYHAHEPISLRFAIKASKKTRKKVIFDSHESWVGGTIKEKIIKRLYLKKIAYLITVNPGILKLFIEKGNLKLSEIIYNASLTHFFEKNRILHKNDSLTIVHEGSLLFNRGLKNMINALVLVKKQYPNVILKIVGRSPKKESEYLEKMINEHHLKNNIIQTGWINYENVNQELKNCDIGLILFSKTKNNMYSTSNKLFNYIASNMAIVSVDLPETSKILKPLNNSIIVKSNDAIEIYNSLIFLLNDPDLVYLKRKASQVAYNNLNWDTEEEKLIQFYEKVIND